MISSRTRFFIALAGSLVLAGGCTDGSADSAILILQNQVPGAGCQISTSLGSEIYPAGQIDTQSTLGYLFNPIVKNYAVSTGSATQRLVFLQGVDVEIDFEDNLLTDADVSALNDLGVTRFSIPLSGVIEPDGGTLALSFEIISPDILQVVAGKTTEPTLIHARIAAFGTMAGGDVRSQTFSYPVTVCTDCSTRDVGLCTALPAAYVSSTANPCNSFQDGVTDCCGDGAGGMTCPAVPVVVEPPP